MEKNKNNNNSSNSLVFGRWPQTIKPTDLSNLLVQFRQFFCQNFGLRLPFPPFFIEFLLGDVQPRLGVDQLRRQPPVFALQRRRLALQAGQVGLEEK